MASALDTIGDLVKNNRALGGRGLAPGILGGVRRIERLFDVLGGRARHLAEWSARHRCRIAEVLTTNGRRPITADEVIVLRSNDDALFELFERLMNHGTPP
jgi:hypothetical protein